jgi:hypothetical protein
MINITLSPSWIAREIVRPQNWYDLTILALSHMPKKHTAIALAAIASGTALYALRPETLLAQCNTVVIASVLAGATTEIANRVANKLWEQRLSTLRSVNIEITEEIKKEIEKSVNNILNNINLDAIET